jgi:ABC-type antimicrobial peptide transport system permease subunit
VPNRAAGSTRPLRQASLQAADGREFLTMPSLLRLLMVVGLMGGFAYGAMFALANFVTPKQREMSITIPQQRLIKPN